jgi:hypothetical protein
LPCSGWYRLIPIAFITYSLAYLDRANFGFAAAGGMAKDLNITAAISSLLGSLFFLVIFSSNPRCPLCRQPEREKIDLLVADSLGRMAMATGMINNIAF